MAIISSPLSDASPPEARDKLKCNCQGRISKQNKSRPKKSQTKADRSCGAHVNKSVMKVDESYNFIY